MREYKLSDLFSFDKQHLILGLLYDQQLSEKFKDSFNYITTKLPIQKLMNDLGKLKWDKGKNYDWAAVKDNKVILMFRRFGTHFTVFYKNENPKADYKSKYGCFMIHSNTEVMSDKDNDRYVDNPFIDMNTHVKTLIKMISDNEATMLWNPYSFERPKHMTVENIWEGGESVHSLDKFLFCCDELFQKYLELFSENDVFEKIKTIKKGEVRSGYEITEVKTDLKNNYYHGVGLKIKCGYKDEKWEDVYSLTRWYLYVVFPELKTNDEE